MINRRPNYLADAPRGGGGEDCSLEHNLPHNAWRCTQHNVQCINDRDIFCY